MTTLTLRAALLLVALAHTVAESTAAQAPTRRRIRSGLEVLLRDSLHLIKGKRVGLITNHTGQDITGRSTADVLHATPGVRLTALFGPEHGIRGAAAAGAKVASSVDSATGVPVYSLYGETRVPTEAMLKDVDVLVYDIQDVGARIYTYPWTMALSAEAAKRPFIILDRPNLIRADIVGGSVLDPKFKSFVGQYPVAMRYGLTIGELAKYLVGTGQITADIHVVPMDGYRRDMWWNDTGLAWVNPSPNIRSGDAAVLYTGTAFFEGTNLSEGRGTPMPFQMIGASWLTDAGEIARTLNKKRIRGVVFDSVVQLVEAGQKFGGQSIPMIVVVVSDRDEVNPETVGLQLLREIYSRHPKDLQWRKDHLDRLAGTDRLRAAVEKEGGVEELLLEWQSQARDFAAKAAPYRIYR